MKENSREVDIKIIEYNMKCIRNVMNNFEDELCENMQTKTDEVSKIIDNILSDYKRVLKENEELKQDRNNDYQMILLAQNEALGYMQGYEDGKKLKRSAVANIVENQQYYILNKQIKELQKENEKKDKIIDLMANHTATSDNDLCEYLDITTKCKYYAGDNGKTCDECIKQYFEKKVEEEYNK